MYGALTPPNTVYPAFVNPSRMIFASGLIYGLMTTENAELAVNYGAAHGALAMTTPGDTTMASKKEVEAIMGGAGARVQR